MHRQPTYEDIWFGAFNPLFFSYSHACSHDLLKKKLCSVLWIFYIIIQFHILYNTHALLMWCLSKHRLSQTVPEPKSPLAERTVRFTTYNVHQHILKKHKIQTQLSAHTDEGQGGLYVLEEGSRIPARMQSSVLLYADWMSSKCLYGPPIVRDCHGHGHDWSMQHVTEKWLLHLPELFPYSLNVISRPFSTLHDIHRTPVNKKPLLNQLFWNCFTF